MLPQNGLSKITKFKQIITNSLKFMNLRISLYSKSEIAEDMLVSKMKYLNIDMLIDVGANVGQFATTVRRLGFNGKIFSFEPISYCHNILIKKAKKDNRWTIMPRVALGSSSLNAQINISKNLVSSSLLNILPATVYYEATSVYEKKETVAVRRLDDQMSFAGPQRMALKIDTQGYEREVIMGALGIIDNIDLIQTEISLTPLYESEAEFLDLFRIILELGYRCIGIFPGFRDRASGEIIQVDAVFVKDAVTDR